MNLFDLVVFGGMIVAGIGGWRLGFITRVLSWAGLVVGLFAAVRLLPPLVKLLDLGEAGTLGLSLGLVFAGALVGQAAGFTLGARWRPVAPVDEGASLDTVDRLAGAVAGVVGMLLIVWLLLPLLSGTTGDVARQVKTSEIAKQLDQRLPDPPDAVQSLRSFLGPGQFPEVFDSLQATPDVGPPPEASGLDGATATQAARSVVMILSESCGQVAEGTGWVIDDGLVVTNAHVVAGNDQPQVVRDDGERFDADVVAFDPSRDIAVLAVSSFGRPALARGDAAAGDVGAVFGHPGGEPLRLAPASVARVIDATGRNIYGAPGADREVLEMAASLRPGDSGAPVIDPSGSVIGMVFAIATDRSGVAYALTMAEVDEVLAAGRSGETQAGTCLR